VFDLRVVSADACAQMTFAELEFWHELSMQGGK
jgi:hypothetical protein